MTAGAQQVGGLHGSDDAGEPFWHLDPAEQRRCVLMRTLGGKLGRSKNLSEHVTGTVRVGDSARRNPHKRQLLIESGPLSEPLDASVRMRPSVWMD